LDWAANKCPAEQSTYHPTIGSIDTGVVTIIEIYTTDDRETEKSPAAQSQFAGYPELPSTHQKIRIEQGQRDLDEGSMLWLSRGARR